MAKRRAPRPGDAEPPPPPATASLFHRLKQLRSRPPVEQSHELDAISALWRQGPFDGLRGPYPAWLSQGDQRVLECLRRELFLDIADGKYESADQLLAIFQSHASGGPLFDIYAGGPPGVLHTLARKYREIARRRSEQSAKGSTAKPNALARLIASIVTKKPDIKRRELLAELRRQQGGEVVIAVTASGMIRWRRDRGAIESTKPSNLRNFLRTARRKPAS